MVNTPILFVVTDCEVANICGQCGQTFEKGEYLILVTYGREVYFLGRPLGQLLGCCGEKSGLQLAIFADLESANKCAQEYDRYCEEAIANGTGFEGLDIPLIENPDALVLAVQVGILLSEVTRIQ